MLQWKLLHKGATMEHLGFIPDFLSENDPRPAREQLDTAYEHGGGWHPFTGFKMTDAGITYPGDPIRPVLAEAHLRDETIRFYDGSWVAIIQKDGSTEISRMD